MQGILGLCLAMAPAAGALLSSRFSTNVMLGQSTVGAFQPLSRPPTTRRRSRSSFEGTLWSKTFGDEQSEANRRLSSNQPGCNTDASAVTATTAVGTALADGTATSASMATSETLRSREMPSNENSMAPAPTADEVAQYEQHWTFLLQAELSKSMSDVQSRLSTWSREKLASEGLLVTHLACNADTGDLFAEKLVTLTPITEGYFDVVPGGLFRKFMPGDRVALSSVAYPEQSDADDTVPGTGGPTSTADYCEPIEAMVVDRTAHMLQLTTGYSYPPFRVMGNRKDANKDKKEVESSRLTWRVDKLGSAASHDKMVAAVRGVAAAANKDRKLSETVQKGACTEAIAAAAAAANAPAAAAAIMAAAIVNAGAYNEGADTTEAEIMSAKQELASLPLSSSLLRLLVGTHRDWEKARAVGEPPSASSESSATGAGNSTVSSDTSGSSGSSSSTGSGRDGVSALKSRNPLDDMEGVNDDVSNPAPATTPETANTAASTAASSTATVATPAAAAAAASLTALKAATAAARGVLWNQLAAAPPEGLPSSPAEIIAALNRMDGVGENAPARPSSPPPALAGAATATNITQGRGSDKLQNAGGLLAASSMQSSLQQTRAVTEVASSDKSGATATAAATVGAHSRRNGRNKEEVPSATLISRAAKGEWNALYHATPAQRNDKALVGAAVHGSWRAFFFASSELKADRDMVKFAVSRCWSALQYASLALRNDKSIVMDALAQSGDALKFASDELKADKEVVLMAVAQKGMALRHAHPSLQADPVVVLTAVNQFGSALQFASVELKQTRTIVETAAKRSGLDALFYAHNSLRDDEAVVLAAVQQSGRALQLASARIQGDLQVVTAAVEQWPRAVQFASAELQDHPQVLAAAERGVAAAAAAASANATATTPNSVVNKTSTSNAAAVADAAPPTVAAASTTTSAATVAETITIEANGATAKSSKIGLRVGKPPVPRLHLTSRQADWVCSHCGNINYARRGACRFCHSLAPVVSEAVGSLSLPTRSSEVTEDSSDSSGRSNTGSSNSGSSSDIIVEDSSVAASAAATDRHDSREGTVVAADAGTNPGTAAEKFEKSVKKEDRRREKQIARRRAKNAGRVPSDGSGSSSISSTSSGTRESASTAETDSAASAGAGAAASSGGNSRNVAPPINTKLKKRPMSAPQRTVVAAAMARRLTLIQGPPGTGKTIIVARVVQAAVYLKRQKRQLLRMQCSRRAATTAAARAAHKEALAAAAAALGTSDSTPLPPALEPEVLRANAAADAAAAAEERALMSRKVLAAAATNTAADLIMNKLVALGLGPVRLGRPSTVAPHLQDRCLDALVERHPDVVQARKQLNSALKSPTRSLYNPRQASSSSSSSGSSSGSGRDGNGDSSTSSGSASGNSAPSSSSSSTAVGDASRALTVALRQSTAAILRAADVVVCSCVGAGHEVLADAFSGTDGSPQVRFATVVVDEASMCTEPSLLVPLMHGCRQLIMVGDQQQLTPTVTSAPAAFGGLGLTPFVRLARCGVRPLLLTDQYRMSPEIAEFPSQHFYGGRLVTGRGAGWHGGRSRYSGSSGSSSSSSGSGGRRSGSSRSLGTTTVKFKNPSFGGSSSSNTDSSDLASASSDPGTGGFGTSHTKNGKDKMIKKRSLSKPKSRSKWNSSNQHQGVDSEGRNATTETVFPSSSASPSTATEPAEEQQPSSFSSSASSAHRPTPFRTSAGPPIARFSRGGAPIPGGFPWPRRNFPVAFVPTRRAVAWGDEELSADGTSVVNRVEAQAVIAVVRLLLVVGRYAPTAVAVLSSYNAQVALLRELLDAEHSNGRTWGADKVEVSTVDGFQGREKGCIVFSAVRSNGQGRVGFMADGRRLNVALTRARQGMITVGDDLTLRAGSKHWAAYLDWLSSQGAVFGDCSGLASSAAAFADAIVAIEGLKVRNMERVAGRIAAMEKNTSSTVLNSNDNGRTVVDIEGIDEEVEKLESERRALSSSPSSSLSSDASSRYMAMRLSSAEADALLREGDLDDGAWALREDRDNHYRVKVAALARATQAKVVTAAAAAVENAENTAAVTAAPPISGGDAKITTALTDDDVDAPALAAPLDANYDLADECDAFVGLGDEEAYENCLVNSAQDILEGSNDVPTSIDPTEALPVDPPPTTASSSPSSPLPATPAEPALKPWQIAQANAEAKRAAALAAKAASMEDTNDGDDKDVVIVVSANSVDAVLARGHRSSMEEGAFVGTVNGDNESVAAASATSAAEAPLLPPPMNYAKMYPKLPRNLIAALNEIATLKRAAMVKGATAEEATLWIGIDMIDLNAQLLALNEMPSTGGKKAQIATLLTSTLKYRIAVAKKEEDATKTAKKNKPKEQEQAQNEKGSLEAGTNETDEGATDSDAGIGGRSNTTQAGPEDDVVTTADARATPQLLSPSSATPTSALASDEAATTSVAWEPRTNVDAIAIAAQDIAAARLADKDVDTSSSNNNNNKGRFLDRVPRERTAEVLTNLAQGAAARALYQQGQRNAAQERRNTRPLDT